MLDAVTRVAFEPYLNTSFRVSLEAETSLDIELVEVTDKTPAGFPGEQFSLLFRGSLEPFLHQQTYTLQHPDMGRLDLFLVPVAQRKDGYRYEAYFNRATLDDE